MAWYTTIYPCDKCGRNNRINGKKEDIILVKCSCGKTLLNKIT